MSVFIPKKLCKEMTDAMSEFWWEDIEDQKRMHWMAWWRMCIPKKDEDSLCAKVLKAKYYPNCHLLKAGPKKGSSFTWQSIVAGLCTFFVEDTFGEWVQGR